MIRSNISEYSVSEISFALKSAIEDQFGLVRVRGEISGAKRAASGHYYLTLKDDKSVLDAVCWRGVASRLSVKPEDGLEVICTGKLTTYPSRSRYQLVIEQMEPAGEGALLALLEERKRKLEAEGLFDPATKKPLPFLPSRIGIVTSPTGAVIRDILHRLDERFPSYVVLAPVRVQGDGAALEVAAAIEALNRLKPAPDLIIVARGGGSIEDLWAFNEEVVARAVFASVIPVVSAVGHETDTTLVDYVSDKRAPTPTAAAEISVPVRQDLLIQTSDLSLRLKRGLLRQYDEQKRNALALFRALPNPKGQLEMLIQRLDDWSDRLELRSPPKLLTEKKEQLERLAQMLPDLLKRDLTNRRHDLSYQAGKISGLSPGAWVERQKERTLSIKGRLKDLTALYLQRAEQRFGIAVPALDLASSQKKIDERSEKLEQLGKLMESFSHKKVLERGYALIYDASGKNLVSSKKEAGQQKELSIVFHDGDLRAKPVSSNSSFKKLKAKPRQENLL